jgi:hypothetical protein
MASARRVSTLTVRADATAAQKELDRRVGTTLS